ncbi:MAG: hypothetical protein ACUVRD_08285 [Bacteroidia bacterium]
MLHALLALWMTITLPGSKDVYLNVKYDSYYNQILVTYQVPKEASLYICDAIGVVHHKEQLSPTQKQISLSADLLSEGPYWALLYIEGELVVIKRFVVQKM